MPVADLLSALQTLLRTDPQVTTLAAGRVFRVELPDDQAASMPRGAIVIARTGGLPDRGYLRMAHHRVDVRCYGRNDAEAFALWGAVHELFKGFTRRRVGNTVIETISLDGGLVETREPETDWPLCWHPYMVYYAETPVAA